MSFMESYKRLDNLCKSFSNYPKGISSYIELMENSSQIEHKNTEWWSVYNHLKRYRHIRNQIAHDSGVYENDVCCKEDVAWLEAFRHSILNQTDPLSEYFKANRASAMHTSWQPSQANRQAPVSDAHSTQSVGCALWVALVGLAVLAAVILITVL